MTGQDVLWTLFAATFGYLVGSLSGGLVAGRLWGGVDVRQTGSGRAGATNVLRALGWRAAALAFAIDIGKGALAMGVAAALGGVPAQVGAGLGVVLGHNWPLYSGFRGGRGVAPAVGAALVVAPPVALAGIGLALLAMALSRYVSLGSLVGTLSWVLIIAVLALIGQQPLPIGLVSLAVGALIFLQHWDNILRIAKGTERRLGERV